MFRLTSSLLYFGPVNYFFKLRISSKFFIYEFSQIINFYGVSNFFTKQSLLFEVAHSFGNKMTNMVYFFRFMFCLNSLHQFGFVCSESFLMGDLWNIQSFTFYLILGPTPNLVPPILLLLLIEKCKSSDTEKYRVNL